MKHSSSAATEVVVAPLAAGREALGLAAAVCAILLLAGLRVAQVAPKQAGQGLQSYQLQDIKLKNQAPAMYRSLLSAVDTIIWLHDADGSWPDVAALKNEALPPFADKFLPPGLRGFFSWELHQGATWADYYGSSRSAAAGEKAGADPLENSFILRIIDFQAGKYPYPAVQQQENRFSAQIWINPKIADYPEGQPAERGWKWIVSSSAAGKVN